jgi:putative endonuclease
MSEREAQPGRSSLPADGRKRLGAAGERLAAEQLQRSGYLIRAMNYHCRAGEVDIVAEEGGDIVFVEVKTRRGTAYGLPEEAVTPAKQRKLVSAAQTYLAAHEQLERAWRVDVVAIALTPAGLLQEVRIHRHALEG